MSSSTTKPNVTKPEWDQVTDNARDALVSAGAVASHLGSAAGVMATQAAVEIGKQADGLAARAGVGLQDLGDRLSESVPQAGTLGNASQAAAKAIHGGGEYLAEAKLSGIAGDVARLIRRNPIPAVLIAIGLGWFLSRKSRG